MGIPWEACLPKSQKMSTDLAAISTLTGATLKLVPFCGGADRVVIYRRASVCRLITRTAKGRAACVRFARSVQDRLRTRLALCAQRCFAGFTELAVPIVVLGTPVAALFCGEFFARKRVRREFDRWLRHLRRQGIHLDAVRTRERFLRTPVITPHNVWAIRHLLVSIARELQSMGNLSAANAVPNEPPCVRCARRFAVEPVGEGGATAAAAKEAHVTREYFCRAFKAAAGVTFSEYRARCRVEKAKELLSQDDCRITDVAFAAGFCSIPHFNHTFRRYAGVSPSAYRNMVQA